MRTFHLLASVWLAIAAATWAGEPPKPVDSPQPPLKPTLPPGTPAEQVKALIGQYDAASAELRKRSQAAKSDEEQEKLHAFYPDQERYAALLVEIAENHPKDPAAFDALMWAAKYGSKPPQRKDTPFAKAKMILARDYVMDPRIGPFCRALRYAQLDPMVVGVLREVLAKNPNKSAQAQAAFTLAAVVHERASWAENFTARFKPEQVEAFEKTYGKQAVADVKRQNPTALRKEYEELLEHVLTDKDYAATVIDRGDAKVSLGELADRELFSFRHLQPGKPAPEIEGEDIDGVKFKLSDYRGKVVLLDFWGHW